MAASIDGITEEELEKFVSSMTEEDIMEILTNSPVSKHDPTLLPPRPFANTRRDFCQEDLEEMPLHLLDEGDLIIDEDPHEERICSVEGTEVITELGPAGGREEIAGLSSAGEDIITLASPNGTENIIELDEDIITLDSPDGTENIFELDSARGTEEITELDSEVIAELGLGGDEITKSEIVFSNSLTEEDLSMTKEQRIQSLVIPNHVSLQYRFLASSTHSNLVRIDLSNSFGVEDEEEILNLLKKDMTELEYLDISYIRFRNPKYLSKQVFANAFWKHVADHAIHRWPKLHTVTAYGYPLKSASNLRKMAQKLQNINATVLSARTARNMLKMMPEETAKNSNLCDKWSDLIRPGKTQYTNTNGTLPVDDEFISVLVPSHLDIDVDHIEGEVARSVETIVNDAPLGVSIAIAFPFFVAKSRQSPQYTLEEIELLGILCLKAFKFGLDEKYAMQLELFLTELIKDDKGIEFLAILFNQSDEVGHNIFTRHLGSRRNGGGTKLLVNVEKCIKRRMTSMKSPFTG